MTDTPKKKTSFSQLITEMAISIILPTLILKKLSGDDELGATMALVLALSLPLGYGIYQFVKDKKVGFVPALGFISILLTGSIGLLELDAKYIAIKEALIPLVIGIATIISIKTPYPLVRTFIYNDMVLQVHKVDEALEGQHSRDAFDSTLVKATYMLASSFFLSATLNYALAKFIVTAQAGTAEFNDQLGTMNLLSYPVIVLPCMVIMIGTMIYLFKQIEKLTGLKFEQILNEQ